MMPSSTDPRTALELIFPGESEMARLSRVFDWASTPLGPADGWPPSLTVTVRNLIAARSPMFLYWGPDLIQFYNDAYRPSLGDDGRHPRALGASGASFWPDIWDVIGPEIHGVLNTGVATWHEDVYIPIDRDGRRDDVWWTYGYSAVFTESGSIGGVLVVCQETTQRMLTERARVALTASLVADRMRLSAIFEHAPAFLAMMRDPDHTFVLANPAYQRLIGHRDVIGKTLAGALPEVRDQGFIELLDRVRETGEPFEGRNLPVTLAREPGAPLETRYANFVYQRLREADGAYAIVAHGVDVTDEVVSVREMRETQAELQRSQKRLRDLIDGVGPSMFIGLLTPEGIIVEASRSALEAAGLQPDDVLGTPFVDSGWWAYSSQEQERLRETIALAAHGEASRYDTQVRGADGSLIDVDFSLQPLRDEAGHVVFLVPSGAVITERKATETTLRETTEKFHLLANNITDVFWIRSADMREVLYLSPGFERIWGVSARTFYANPQQWTDFIVAEDRERVRIAFDALTRDTPSVDVEHRITRPDGEIRWVRTRGFQVRDAAGKLIRLTGIVTDITESRRGAQALQDSLDEFRMLAEAMPQIVWITRPDGWNVYLNQQWYDYTGLTPDASRGSGWSAPFHPDDQARAVAAWQNATATGGVYSLECRIRRSDGLYRWWLIRGVPIRDANGTLLKWFGTCTDVHDIKLAELEISRINRALLMLSNCNEALIRAEHEQELLVQVCKVAVETGGYRMAWVGYAQNDAAHSITPMGHAGAEDGYLSDIQANWSNAEAHGIGPGGQVIRSGQPVVCEDVEHDPCFAHLLEPARRRGYRGNIVLPLRDATRTFGLLSLYTGEVKHTSAEELALLQQMAGNVAFGIGNLRAQLERNRLQSAVATVAAGVSLATGTEFFQQLVLSMTSALGAQGGMMSQLLPGEPPAVRNLAVVVEGQVVANHEFAIRGTPSEFILTMDSLVIRQGAWEQYHQNAPITLRLKAEGLVALRLTSSTGRHLGLLGAVFHEPLEQVDFVMATLKIFAARAAAEMERQDADAHIREQAALLDIAHEAILVRDLDGRITFWNKGAERTYGWTAVEAIGRTDADLLNVDIDVMAAAQAALMVNGEWQGEMLKRTKDGRDITADVRWTLVRDDHGEAKAVLTIGTDITEKRTLQSQLMVSDRMASVGTLAAGVAHEINNPLAAVIANLDYIIEGLANKSDPSAGRSAALTLDDIRGSLADASEAAQRVRFIVRDLKVFSRSPTEEANGPVDVKATMESSVGMAWNEIRHRARLIKEYGAVPPVEANEARLGQVFLNL
ncbi:MAG: PAS domain S-box protein, partial [bacterium]